MKLHFRKWIASNWPICFLVLFEIVLAAKNIVPGTWLTGWDSTQPELNFKLNLFRSLSSVWQEYRGVGLPDGMAHAANIVHLFYVWILSLVVPDNLVRYIFIFLAHLVGGIGMYKLLQYLLKKSNWLALAGAIFYLLNPITIQMFYQPLELFIIHFAGLPWLLLTLVKYLEDGGKRNLTWLAIVLLAFVSQNHVPTIFIVTMMAVGLILIASLIGSRGLNFKKVLVVVGVVLGINSFWLLPYMVTTMSNSQVIPQAKMNLLSNPEVILRNAEYGDLSNVARMQGFSLGYEDWHTDGPNGLQMPQWASWWDTRSIEIMMWVVFGLVLLGIIRSVWKRDWKLVSIGLIWIVALFNLGVRIPVIDQVMTWVYANVPLYAAVFRFAFTKFSIIFAFTSTILMIYALDELVKKWGKVLVGIILIGASLWIGWPIFRGNFLYKELRVNWPSEYQGLFNYFDKAEVGRMVRLPAFDLWGWESNSWGYRGSGVVWQGVRSPMLVRSFDPWSPYNETFYNQFSNALYGCDINSQIINSPILKLNCKEQFAKVLDKYDVQYVFLDESVIAPGQDREILRIEETKRLASELGREQKFQEGFLTVWDRGGQDKNFVSAPASYTWVETETNKVRRDVAWEGVGHYVTSNKLTQQQTNVTTAYPFSQLMKEETKGVEYGEGRVTLISNHKFSNSQMQIPGWQVGDIVRINYLGDDPLPAYKVNGQNGPVFLGKEKPEEGKSYIVARVSEGEEWEEYVQDARFQILDSRIEITVEGDVEVYDFASAGEGTIGNCDVLKRGTVLKTGTNYSADERGAVCDYVVMSKLDTRLSYLMRLQGENIEGRSLKFFLYNTGSKRNDIESLLSVQRTASGIQQNKFDSTFSLLPWLFDGTYTLNIETRSFGQRAENVVEPVEVRWFPLEQIANARITPSRSDLVGFEDDLQPTRSDLQIAEVKKYGTWLYIVDTKNGGLLKLSQGYDEGWMSPYLEHMKVDGWANGWMVPAGEHQIIIFYWPQLLQYAGFVLLGVTMLLIVRQK